MKKRRIRYVFWSYDLFPYVLSAKAVGVTDRHGYIKIEGYGPNAAIRPLAVLSGDKGKTTSENLSELRAEYRAAQRALSDEFCEKALAIAPFLERCIHTSAYKKRTNGKILES